ncbi:MAG TPA: tetratricopeptide repeat protein [Candidatus Limnocylindria bacterium]|jgi:tetratricopeptide (TPR) repeat protein
MRSLSRTFAIVTLASFLAACGGGAKSEADLSADALNRGLKAHNAGNFDEATAAYFEALSHDGKNKFAYFNLGQIAQTRKKPAIAEGYYRSALDIDTSFAAALFNLAIIRNDFGAKAEAIDLYRRDIQADPNNAAAYFNLALILRDTGSGAEANQMFQRAQQLDPKLVPPASPSATPRQSASPSPTR